jgi:hypothetical protein
MNEVEFFLKEGMPIVEFDNMEFAWKLGMYGRVEIEIQADTLLVIWSQRSREKKEKKEKKKKEKKRKKKTPKIAKNNKIWYYCPWALGQLGEK